MRAADTGVEQAQVVVDAGDGADRGEGIAAGGLLVDGDGGRKAFDHIGIGFVQLTRNRPGIGGERFDMARRPSAKVASNARLDFPDPDTPAKR